MSDEPNGGGQGPDPTQAFQNRLKKYDGDAMQFATVLFDENFRLRNDKRELEAKLPGADSVVLPKADADRLAAFDALGKKPEEVTKALGDAETAVTERDTLKRKDILREVADVGFGGSKLKLSVLQDRDKETPGLEYVLKDDPKDKARKVAHVKHEGKEVPLEQFAAERWADYLPALKADGGQTSRPPGDGRAPTPAPPGSDPEKDKRAARDARRPYATF